MKTCVYPPSKVDSAGRAIPAESPVSSCTSNCEIYTFLARGIFDPAGEFLDGRKYLFGEHRMLHKKFFLSFTFGSARRFYRFSLDCWLSVLTVPPWTTLNTWEFFAFNDSHWFREVSDRPEGQESGGLLTQRCRDGRRLCDESLFLSIDSHVTVNWPVEKWRPYYHSDINSKNVYKTNCKTNIPMLLIWKAIPIPQK